MPTLMFMRDFLQEMVIVVKDPFDPKRTKEFKKKIMEARLDQIFFLFRSLCFINEVLLPHCRVRFISWSPFGLQY